MALQESKWAESSAGVFTDLRSMRSVKVLIIDDDVDAALLIATILWRLNCNTVFATDGEDAQRQLVGVKSDLVILDWMLGENDRADKVLDRSIRVINKFSGLSRFHHDHKTKLVTYSSLGAGNIRIPSNPYFNHVGHWQKPVNLRDLVKSVLPLIGGQL